MAEEVGVIGEERPGVNGEAGARDIRGQPGDDGRVIGLVPEDGAPFHAPDPHLVEHAGGIETGLAGHGKARLAERVTGYTVIFLFNLGMYDVVEFTAVIDPAHGAILAVGAIEEKPVVLNGQIVVRHRMRLTGSFDHRIIDGAMGAKFLQEVKKILENPVQLLL